MTNELKTKTWKDCYGKTRTTTFMLLKKSGPIQRLGRPGGPADHWTILIVAQDGWNATGSANFAAKGGHRLTRNSGQPAYIQKIWNAL